jgi:tetratricopeptide (TPR) repeat protein
MGYRLADAGILFVARRIAKGATNMILKCADCGKMISVSSTGYGDKNAIAQLINQSLGDHLATRWLTCGKCGKPYCDKCASKRGGLFRGSKCDCGGTLSEENNLTPAAGEELARKALKDHKEREKQFDEWMKLGAERYNAHKYAEAIEWLGKAIEVMPEAAGAGLYFLRAEACSEVGEYAQEIMDLNKAIELEPTKGIFFGHRGISYFKLGDYRAAVADFSKFIEFGPANAMSYNNRGVAYLKLGNRQAAIMDYKRAVDLDPDGEAGKLAKQNLARLG